MRAINRPTTLVEAATEMGMKAIAITDYGTLAAIWDANKTATKTKLIVGCELNFTDDRQPIFDFNDGKVKTKPAIEPRKLILIAKNAVGYRNLLLINFEAEKCKLNKNSKIDKQAMIDWEVLEKHHEGLICLTSNAAGIVGRYLSDGEIDKARSEALRFSVLFEDDFAFELQPNNLIFDGLEQFAVNRGLYKLSKELGIRCVATSNSYYIRKEQAKYEDLVYALKSHLSYKSRFRPKMNMPNFYLHTADDIIAFFKRNYGQEFAEELCANSVYLADKCEPPEWVRPQFVTGEKALLPEFPVKDQPDYDDFSTWKENIPTDVKETVTAEDKLYMRYSCEKELAARIAPEKQQEYSNRYKSELEVYEPRNFSSYMLITSDFLSWGRNHGVRVGPGRGCLSKNTLVLTNAGFKALNDIDVGDFVYTHLGRLRKVIKRYGFEITGESILRLKLENSFGVIELTKDHKVFACKRQMETVKAVYEYNGKEHKKTRERIVFSDPTWIMASELSLGDYIYTAFPKCRITTDHSFTFDLAAYCRPEDVYDEFVMFHRGNKNEFAIRYISRETNVAFESVRKLKNGSDCIKPKDYDAVVSYLNSHKLTLDEWRQLPKRNSVKVKRFIPLDDELLYVLGLWVGDGSIRYQQKHGINYTFNANENILISKVETYFSDNLGFNVCKNYSTSNSCSLDIGTSILSKLFMAIFPLYKNSSSTKHLPLFFRELSNRQLSVLINGLFDANGHKDKTSETIKTVSLQLAKELKECFDYLHIPSGVHVTAAENKHNRNNATSYLVTYSGITIPRKPNYLHQEGYYSKIIDIEESHIDKVYDITVEEDHSYLTSSGTVHNSVGGSLVGYLLDIHKADPLKYGLIFERFINIEKIDYPDCDNDFDSVGRESVLNYVTNKYGADRVAHVSNFVTFTPKNAVTDVITCLEIGGSRADAFRIAKNITETIPDDAKTLEAAIEHSPLLKEWTDKFPEIKEFSEAIIGLPRSYSTHAAGVVISKYPLAGLVPIRIDDFGNVCLEYEKVRAEENGLIKIDFLGLETLNIIENTNSIIRSLGLPEPQDPPDYDKHDKQVYDMISSGDTFCVFQLGKSGGTIDLCKKVEPFSLEDLAAINALTRPGVPHEVKKSYIERRFGREAVEIPHPNFEKAVKNTMGLPIFEECFLFLAHYFCGWNLQRSDKMRKISKLKAKGKHLLAELQEGFIEGAVQHSGVDKEFAEKIWDEWVIPLSGYAFNKSHAILYSMTSLHTAYLKSYYYPAFMTANLISETKSNSPQAKDNIIKIRHRLRKSGIVIMPPDVNISNSEYKLVSETKLITGFSALRGVKGPAAEEIVSKRPYTSFEDFLMKVDASKVHVPVVEALAVAGALDCFGLSRKSMYLYAADLRKKLKAWEKKKNTQGKPFEYTIPNTEWTTGELRALESHYIGEALTGSKQDSYPTLFVNHGITCIKNMEHLPDKFRVVCELEIQDLFIFRVKNKESKIFNEEVCKMLGEDINNDQISIVLFPEALALFKDQYEIVFGGKSKIEKGFGVRIAGTLSRYQNELSITASEIYSLVKPIQKPKDMDRKIIEIYSGMSKKKLLEKTTEDIEDDLLSILDK